MMAGDFGGAVKQLSTMLSRASGSQQGDSTPPDKSMTRLNGRRRRISSLPITSFQNSSRCCTDQRWSSSYESTPTCLISQAMLVVLIKAGDGTQAGAAKDFLAKFRL